jgi:hypothetical protein
VDKDVTNPYRAFRQLERMLFLGVPERPEPFWEREGNSEMQGRFTGRSQLADQVLSLPLQGGQMIGTIVYRPQMGEVLFEPMISHQAPCAGSELKELAPEDRVRLAQSKDS